MRGVDAILIHPLPPPSSEPTSGLDARAAAIVMRTVRNVGNSSRAVVVTIHQPSIEIFEVRDVSVTPSLLLYV